MKINILDPGLLDCTGHHYDLDCNLANELSRLGCEVSIYANKNFKADVSAKDIGSPIYSHFNANPYDIGMGVVSFAQEAVLFDRHSKSIVKDLNEIRVADMLILPTMDATQLNAIATSGIQLPIAGCFQFDSNSCIFNISDGTFWWKQAVNNAVRARLKLNIGAFEPFLVEDYSQIFCGYSLNALPIPYDKNPSIRQKNELTKIGFFGDQRVEKGSLLIPRITKLSIDAGFEVVLHDSSKKINKDACGLGVFHLELIKNLASEISKCDLVILPYDPSRYQCRGSAVLLESAASGTPVLAPLGTGMASNIANGVCAGLTFSNFCVEDIFACIVSIKSQFTDIAERAYKIQKNWDQKNGIQNFAKFLINPNNFNLIK